MLVVSNTSPLSNLALIGHLEVLREQLREIVIPPAVQLELGRIPTSPGREELYRALHAGWLRVVSLNKPVPAELQARLDNGEAEAIALSLELRAELVLLDESAARAKARQLGLPTRTLAPWPVTSPPQKSNAEQPIGLRPCLSTRLCSSPRAIASPFICG